jgi:transcriptional regulator with XRE-family HTH domain
LRVEPETISRFERGETLPSLVRLAELAEVYEVPLEALVRGMASSPLDQANEIAGELNRLSRDDRDFVRRWVSEMCARLRETPEKGR